MGLLGYSVKAQVSKESSALLKTIQHEEAGFQARNNTLQFNRQRPYVYSPFNCYRCCPPGHFARNCDRKRGRGNSRRYISNDVNFVRAWDAFFFSVRFCTSGIYITLFVHSRSVTQLDGVVRYAFLYELCKRRYLFQRSVFS